MEHLKFTYLGLCGLLAILNILMIWLMRENAYKYSRVNQPAQKDRTLAVRFEHHLVGTLAQGDAGLIFQYCSAWLGKSDAFPLSPKFPLVSSPFSDSEQHQTVSWFFDNLLPEEEQRRQQASEAGVAIDDVFGLLEHYGREASGALTIITPAIVEEYPEIAPLSDGELLRRLEAQDTTSLISAAKKKIAIAGAQPKLLIAATNLAEGEPVGLQSSNYIFKPDTRSALYTNTAANEYFCMSVAQALGLDVPCCVFKSTPVSIVGIERFDRSAADELAYGPIRRRHVIDGAQLLDFSAHRKYELATTESLKQCSEHCSNPSQAKERIFAWIVFNVLIGNADAHMKNISFFVVPGTGAIEVAPFYDLVSTVVYSIPERRHSSPSWPDIPLSMPIGGAVKFSDIKREHLVECGKQLGLSVSKSNAIIDSFASNAMKAARTVYRENEEIFLPAERRLVNSIVHLPIKEMSMRLLQ